MIHNPIVMGGTVTSVTLGGSRVFTLKTGRTLNKDMFVFINTVQFSSTVSGGVSTSVTVSYSSSSGQLLVQEQSGKFYATSITVFYID